MEYVCVDNYRLLLQTYALHLEVTCIIGTFIPKLNQQSPP